jgi:predicted nucleic acid-binding protein
MALIAKVKGQRVCLDTAPFIYLIEEHRKYLPLVEPLFRIISAGESEAVTSTVTLIEVLVRPLRQGEIQIAQSYKEILLHSRGLTVHPLSSPIAEKAAELRAKYVIRTPDAIQLATGILAGAKSFVTNDARLKRITEINVLVLDEYLA